MSVDTNDLMMGISAGRTDALEALVNIYYRYVVNLLYLHGVPQESVEDLAQDVFFKFCKKAQEGGLTFKSEARLKAYLKECAFHITVDYVRRKKRTLVTVDDPEEPIQALEVQSRDNPELRATVSELLGMLSPEDREIILMIEVEGMTHAEAARLRGVTEGTSKNQLLAARKRFMELYRDRQDD
jgi:RNA polymerase sigma-70 factor (ECF subfamily)